MNVGVLVRARDPMSLAIYRESVVRELTALGVGCAEVAERGPMPARGIDLLWDPGLGMRRVPSLVKRCTLPVVATVHGLLAFALPARESARSFADRGRQALMALRVLRDWRALRRHVRRVIAVSPYGADEARRTLSLPEAVVQPILHGVDHDTFRPDGPRAEHGGSYFLMVAQYQPKKNVDRVLEAFAGLGADDRPGLIAVVPGFPAGRTAPAGCRIERRPHSGAELAALYRGAIALVAPSLHETFGMPLAEAMACGCPVVTSDTTACPQVTGDAALHVDPRSVDAIRGAMRRVAGDADLRGRMAERGIARAAELTWRASAERHAEVFRAALRGGVT